MKSRYLAAIAPGGASQARSRALSLSLAVLAATGGMGGWVAAAGAQDVAQAQQGAAGVQKGQVLGTTQRLNLRVRRQRDGVEVVIEGVGSAPELQQTTRGAVWLGRLFTSSPAALPGGGQRLSVPEAGFQSLSLAGTGQVFELQITPIPGYPLGRPVVSADGRDLILSFASSGQASQRTSSLDLRRPGRVSEPTAAYVPPLQPRAVAPPVGDMAVGTMLLTNSSYLNVSGPPVTMTLRNAPARDVLMALSRLGGYGFVFVEDSSKADNAGGTAASTLPISISFRNENYGQALNSALLAAGLQAKRQGNMILAGPSVLGKTFGAQLSKVYRLNQVSANSAADYLANLGAQVKKTNEVTTAVSTGLSQSNAVASSGASSTTVFNSTSEVKSYGGDTGPLLGLLVTTDPRLATITLVGEPRVVTVAESYLRQLDLRQRQVALSVKIMDVSLGNNATFENSFAVRWGNSFIVNNQGQVLANFGSYQPPSTPDAGLPGTYSATGRTTPLVGTGALTPGDGGFVDQLSGTPYPGVTTDSFKRPSFGQFNNPLQPGTSEFTPGTPGTPPTPVIDPVTGITRFIPGTPATPGTITRRSPTNFAYPQNQLFDFVKATIQSSSTKVLASPTLILSENAEELRKGEDTLPINIASLSGGSSGSSSSSGGSDNNATIGRTKANESYVTVGEQVITNYTVTSGTQGNGNSCQPEFGIAGLTFGARVSKIDDNGFVTFSMSPAITAALRQQVVPGCGPIDVLAVRRLDTGSARVRDGQTLIMTGVISDADRLEVSKWPILGDVPIIGQFFRSSNNNRAKRELVILVTPRIINDNEGGNFGYGYQPGTNDSRRLLADPNAPLRSQP
ncbi:MAG: general secretion pathway protein D [Cyanobacteria bacterium]|nr:general secretion pathway protein D [Cyanobacteriota bacterium]